MNEDNEEVTQTEEDAWAPPPLPEEIPAEREEPEMSEAGTLANIFFEPGRTFEDLRRKPRFIIATIIICLCSTGFIFSLQRKLGEDRYKQFVTQEIEKSPQGASLTPEEKGNAVGLQMTIIGVVTYALPVFILIAFALGSLLYWLGVKAMGGTVSFFQAVSVWVYSSFPPTIISALANIVVLFLKSPDEIDIAASQRGLVQANPSLFIGGVDMPVLTTLVSIFDLFLIWGLVLAAIGLQKVGRISKGAAWGIVLILALVGITWRVVSAVLSGNPS